MCVYGRNLYGDGWSAGGLGVPRPNAKIMKAQYQPYSLWSRAYEIAWDNGPFLWRRQTLKCCSPLPIA